MTRNPLYLYGPDLINIPSDLHLGRHVLNNMKKWKDNIAIINVENGCTWTFGQILQQAVGVSLSLTDVKIGRGQVVAVCSEPRLELLSSILGIFCCGATVASINNPHSGESVKQQLNLVKPEILFTSSKFYHDLHHIFKDIQSIKTIVLYDDHETKTVTLFKDFVTKTERVEDFKAVDVDCLEDVALIGFTSGTTGPVKGIQLTHDRIVPQLNNYVTDVKECDRVFLLMSWNTVYCIKFLFGTFCKGARFYFATAPECHKDVHTIYSYIDRYKITVLLAKMATYTQMLTKEEIRKSYNLSSLSWIWSAGAYYNNNRIHKLMRLLGLAKWCKCYGLSETGVACTHSLSNTLLYDDKDSSKAVDCNNVLKEIVTWNTGQEVSRLDFACSGRPLPGVIIKVVDLKDGTTLGPNKLGEICLKTRGLMKGYIGLDITLDEGWFRTGDIGHYDAEQNIYVWERIANLVKVDGYFVAPTAVESALLNYPGIKDVAVILWNNQLRAFAELDDDVTIQEGDVQRYVKNLGVQGYSLGGGVRVVAQIPRNGNKLDRKALLLMHQFTQH